MDAEDGFGGALGALVVEPPKQVTGGCGGVTFKMIPVCFYSVA